MTQEDKPMHSIITEQYFWASHSVLLPDGMPEIPHSHNFCVAAEVTADSLDDKAMVMDFIELCESLKAIIAPLTDNGIEQLSYFAEMGQSTEIIARYIFENLESTLPQGVNLACITVTEEPGCKAVFRK